MDTANTDTPARWIAALTDRGARFADGRVADFGDASGELAAARDGAALVDLSHEGVIHVSGADATSFLQAQLCNDLLALPEGAAQWNGWCSPKGRLLASFLVRRAPDGYFLHLPRALQPAIQKRLGMFVLRSKVVIRDAGDDAIRLGVAGPAAAQALAASGYSVPEQPMTSSPDGQVTRLSATRFLLAAAGSADWAQLAAHARPAGAAAWDWHGIGEGVVQVAPATQDAFVPQMANFELAGGVSFKKGCYPGQEIVARTQYRGILKRRMVRVRSAAALAAGDSVFSAVFGDQAAGTVANAAPSPDGGFEALVVAQIEAIRAGDLRLASLDGPVLSLLPLTYAVPELAP